MYEISKLLADVFVSVQSLALLEIEAKFYPKYTFLFSEREGYTR